MLTRGQFFKKMLRRTTKETGESAEKVHVPLSLVLGVIILAFVVLAGIPAAVHFHEEWGIWVLVVLVIVAAIVFVYRTAFEGYYAIYQEEAQKAVELAARLEPKFEILDATVNSAGDSDFRCRVQVRSLTDVSLRFGASLVEIDPVPEVSGFQSSHRLQIADEKEGVDMAYLPGRSTRWVEVFVLKRGGISGAPILLLYGANYPIQIGLQPYRRVVIAAYAEQSAKTEQKAFRFLLTGSDSVSLEALPVNEQPKTPD
jgi:hypothetical protein